jgi:Arc/MetJ family transcription regulator
MSPHNTETIVNTPNSEIVHIDRAMFARIEEQQATVAFTDGKLRKAAEAHKDAKKDHENALETLKALVGAMIRRVNGEPEGAELPLFDNQTDAIEAANADPVVSKLVSRMLDHGISHVNALVVAGYDEEQRNELAQYLEAMDLRKDRLAQPEGFEPVPEVVVPAFLLPQEDEAITDSEVADALRAVRVELKKKHIRLMSPAQRRETLDWSAQVQEVTERLGEAVTMDDLPPAPSYIMAPKELEAAAADGDTITGDGSGDALPAIDEADQTPKKARAPRRSSKDFKNSPRMAGKIKKANGRKSRQAVN